MQREKNYNLCLRKTENEVKAILKKQVKNEENFEFGGIKNIDDGFCHPGEGAKVLRKLISVFSNEDSCYFKSEKLSKAIKDLIGYLARVQRPDGTFDLLTTNFYSSPDAGFIMQELASGYKIIEKYNVELESKEDLYKLIYNCGQGMVGGGFHTPNHRWVISAGLMMAYNITGDSDFKEEANDYLEEGIDCNENGEFTERSAGIYNAENDKSLILISQTTEDN